MVHVGYCIVCGRTPVEIHHVFTRGALGKRADVPENMVHLCTRHHMGWHELGRETGARVYGLEDVVKQAREALQEVLNERQRSNFPRVHSH